MQLVQNVCCCQSIEAGEDLEQFQLVGFDGKTCAEGKPALGTAEVPADKGEMATVNVLGIMVAQAGAAITVGAVLQSDGNGQVIPQGAAVANVLPAAVGIALDAATAAGDGLRILRGA